MSLIRLPLCLLLAMLGLGRAAFAQSATEVESPSKSEPVYAAVIANWQLGDRWDVEVVTGSRDWLDDGGFEADSSITSYRKVITQIGPDYYRARWYTEGYETTEELGFDPTTALDPAAMRRITADGFVFRLSAMGAIIQMENYDLMLELVDQLMEEIITNMATSPEEEARVRGVFAAMGGPAFVLDQSLEPIELFYALNGYEWRVKEELTYRDVITLAESEIETFGTVLVHDFDLGRGTFVLTETTKADGRQLRSALTNLFSAGGIDTQELDDELGDMGIELVDTNRFVVDFNKGVLVRLDRLRVTTTAGSRSETFVRIRVTEP